MGEPLCETVRDADIDSSVASRGRSSGFDIGPFCPNKYSIEDTARETVRILWCKNPISIARWESLRISVTCQSACSCYLVCTGLPLWYKPVILYARGYPCDTSLFLPVYFTCLYILYARGYPCGTSLFLPVYFTCLHIYFTCSVPVNLVVDLMLASDYIYSMGCKCNSKHLLSSPICMLVLLSPQLSS